MEGNKVKIKFLQHDHIEQLRLWRNTQDIRENTRIYHDITMEEQENWYQNHVVNHQRGYYFAIYTHNDNFIGFCSITNIDNIAKHGEFSIYIGNEKFHGLGYGSDAIRCLLKYGFEILKLNKIWGEVFSSNENALNLYLHLGFKEEGRLKNHHYSEKYGLIDTIIVSKFIENKLLDCYEV